MSIPKFTLTTRPSLGLSAQVRSSVQSVPNSLQLPKSGGFNPLSSLVAKRLEAEAARHRNKLLASQYIFELERKIQADTAVRCSLLAVDTSSKLSGVSLAANEIVGTSSNEHHNALFKRLRKGHTEIDARQAELDLELSQGMISQESYDQLSQFNKGQRDADSANGVRLCEASVHQLNVVAGTCLSAALAVLPQDISVQSEESD